MDYKEMEKMIKKLLEEVKMLKDSLIAENEQWEEDFTTQEERNRWEEFWNGFENEVDETRDVLSMSLMELIEKDEKVVPYAKSIASIFNSKEKEVSKVGENKNAVQSENKLTGNFCRGEFEATAILERLDEYDLDKLSELLKAKSEKRLFVLEDSEFECDVKEKAYRYAFALSIFFENDVNDYIYDAVLEKFTRERTEQELEELKNNVL